MKVTPSTLLAEHDNTSRETRVKDMTTINSIRISKEYSVAENASKIQVASPTDIIGVYDPNMQSVPAPIRRSYNEIDPIARRRPTDDLGLTNTIIRMPLVSQDDIISEVETRSQVEGDSLLRAIDEHNERRIGGLTPCNLLAGSILGIGTGCAMMPIFNNELYGLDNYGIDVHDIEAFYIISTLNTLLFTSLSNIAFLARKGIPALTDNRDISATYAVGLAAGGIGALTSSLLPLSQMWEVELNDAKVDGVSGFNKFTAWATFCTIPLVVVKTIECFHGIENFIKNYSNVKIESVGGKLATYVITGLSALARGVCYQTTTTELAKDIGFDDETAEIMGIVIGGIIASSTSLLTEFNALKNIFKKQEFPISKKEVALGTVCALEGMWFALPMISSGLNATENWNPLLKGAIFTPLFVSRSIFEASVAYNAIKPNSWNKGVSLGDLRLQDKDKEISTLKLDLTSKNKIISQKDSEIKSLKDNHSKVFEEKSNELVDKDKIITKLQKFTKLQNEIVEHEYALRRLNQEVQGYSMAKPVLDIVQNVDVKRELLEKQKEDLIGIIESVAPVVIPDELPVAGEHFDNDMDQ